MLTVYRRHNPDCPNYSDRYWRRCRCPCWAEGTVEGVYQRRTLKTRSFERATELARAIEDGKKVNQPDPLTIEKAVASFLLDAEQERKLREPTLRKYRVVLSQLKTFAADKHVTFLKEIDVEFVRGFRGSWKDGAISGVKKLERMRAFFKFFVGSGDVASNPATAVKAPTPKHCPTLPLSDKEIASALRKAEDPRWHALIQVLRWSGLRIGDAMKLKPEKFDGNRMFLRTAKTGTPVYVPLPPFVIDELKRLPLFGGFYFWNKSGDSHIDTASTAS